MDASFPPQSEYLQSRLRERKAESARAPRHATPSNAAVGRDDDIFGRDDAPDPLGKHRNNPVWHSSPVGPPSRAGSRSTGTKSTTSSQPRAIGAREMDAHVDKLNKENFDLKLELYHRREKIDELERKLRDVQQLETDAAELMEVNQDLCLELEKRDRAIDEAVVMICDLEEKVRLLQEQVIETRPSSFTVETSASTNASACLQDSPRKVEVNVTPPNKPRPNSNALAQVSPDVSARMAALASSDDATKARPVPSFIESTEPTTNALRSMFVHDGRQIRPIPSAISLASGAETKDDGLDGSPHSPNLSELSESDFKSIYGRTTPMQIPPVTLDDLPPSPGESPVIVIPRERKLARTNRWVHDRAISPEMPARRRSSHGSQPTSPFQSLGGALHRDRGKTPQPPSPTLARKLPLRPHVAEVPRPDIRSESTPVQNTLPQAREHQFNDPYPSPIIQDKSSSERFNVADTHAQFTRYLESQARADAQAQHQAPRLFAYDGQQYYEDEGSVVDAQDFGASLFRHEAYARDAASMPLRFAPAQKPALPSVGVSTFRGAPYDGGNSKQSSEIVGPRQRTQKPRPLSVHMASTPSATRPVVNTLAPTLSSAMASERPLHRSISLSPTPSQPSLNDVSATYHTRRTGDLALTPGASQYRTPQRPLPPASVDRADTTPSSQRPFRAAGPLTSARQDATPPIHDADGGPASRMPASQSLESHYLPVDPAQPPKLASSIRQRMARLTNRSNTVTPVRASPLSTDRKALPPLPTASFDPSFGQSPASSTMTGATSNLSGTPTPTNTRPHSRSASATRRFFTQHRRRSSATPVSPTMASLRPASKNGPDALILRPRGSDTSEESARISRSAAFLTAATAAAPYLSFDLSKGAKPIPAASIGLAAPAAPLSSISSPLRDSDVPAPGEGGPPTARERERRGSRSSILGGARDARAGGGEKRMSWTLSGTDGTMAGWRG